MAHPCLPGEFVMPAPPTLCLINPISSLNSKLTSSLFAQFHQDLLNDPHISLMGCHPSGLCSQPPYKGPYRVIKRTDKHFTIELNSCLDTISIDHLKPAHFDSESSNSDSTSDSYKHNDQSTSHTGNVPPTTTPHHQPHFNPHLYYSFWMSGSLSPLFPLLVIRHRGE